jgi:predicted kinase
MQKTIYMLCGPAASGKSFRAKLLRENNPGSVTFCPDDYLTQAHEGRYEWTARNSRDAWAAAQRDFAKWLVDPDAGSVAIWDATFTNSISRSPVLNFSKGLGHAVVAYALQTSREECLHRNSLRPVERRVPESKIEEMLTAFRLNQPTTEEGFDGVINLWGHVPGCTFMNDDHTGRCNAPVAPERDMCTAHSGVRCAFCGQSANMYCARTAEFGWPCGRPICGGGGCSHHRHF